MKFTYFIVLVALLASCNSPKKTSLPFLGPKEISETGDTLYHTITPFSFLSQDSAIITEEYLKGKITIVDFFFTTCPTICPIMTTNMVELQKELKEIEGIQFLSHTVDPETDTPNKLKRYAKRRNANLKNWQFVTGPKEDLYTQGLRSYLVSTQEDALAPGGFLHSSFFALVDQNLKLRGVYDGTNDEEIKKLKKDLNTLINEK
jgi:protein SCO1/2